MNDTLGLDAQLACIWEATARKPGNVHRFADFNDLSYLDFLTAAATLAPVLAEAGRRRVGEMVLEGVTRARRVTATNTNLGILLLLAPLARAAATGEVRTGIEPVLEELSPQDARLVYQAIRLAAPGGLGRVAEQDVREEPTQTLRQVMALAADRDLVARQYANSFREVFEDGLTALQRGLETSGSLETAILACHLQLMANFPDSLIGRKRGPGEAEEAARRARQVLASGWPTTTAGQEALARLDGWLREGGHARNPGTTADLVAASLFVALRTGVLTLPLTWTW